MSAAIVPSESTFVSHASSVVTSRPPLYEQAILLESISWQQYVVLRDEPANRKRRMTFAEGRLEIMTISFFHEVVSLMIDHFIMAWTLAKDLDIQPSGSMTLRRQPLLRGLESDQSYYIQHEAVVRGLDCIDLETIPPPDLAVEVEHTSAAIEKIPIYAALGIPEVWRWSRESLTVYQLVAGNYVECANSVVLPGFPLDQLRVAIGRRHTVSHTTLVREFQQWLQQSS
jgi:Uma2 family endonuclease